MTYCFVENNIIVNISVFEDSSTAKRMGALPSYDGANIGDIYAPPPLPMTESEAREKRDKLLAETDWTQMPDSPLSDEQREAYRIYRQELRDIPSQAGFPASITWPELPTDTKERGNPTYKSKDGVIL
jgi:hypothetical protein